MQLSGTLCLAYARKAASQFTEESALRNFWSEKLGVPADDLKDVPDGQLYDGSDSCQDYEAGWGRLC